MRRRIVIVEDERDISEPLEYCLESNGFDVITVADGVQCLDIIRRSQPHLVLLDIMIPGIDGFEVCRRMKSDTSCKPIPIIMLTAKDDQTDVVLGLGLGADDYVTKPFSTKELLARVAAVLNRGSLQDDLGSGKRFEVGDLVVDSERFEASWGDHRLSLTVTEFKILRCLAENPGCVFTRDDLLGKSIGEHAFVIDRNIDVHIRSIRKKLQQPDLIATIRGVGYRLETDQNITHKS
ncbi:response regulator [Candidatus Pelagisphaera phototrophica]|uniref:response regulator n=1 Tax=Candidatus Pelagisphaera phototrophica TaxID=2684113 RepID=UPI001A0067DB|nr:response regulator transcription factor [Candidatus Pelagisphaera phototrophica]QXD31731.1 response regulator transcription factor [Candidatus Pelagisphaera phototrophica]